MQQAGKLELKMGNEAMARGLIENGCSMATAYPVTPAEETTGILEMQVADRSASKYTVLCMGAATSQAAGFFQAYKHQEKRPDVIATIGDSTCFHAGVPTRIDAVVQNVRFVLVILDNRTTAMTGSRPAPATDQGASGANLVEGKDGQQTAFDALASNGCAVCLDICPQEAIVKKL